MLGMLACKILKGILWNGLRCCYYLAIFFFFLFAWYFPDIQIHIVWYFTAEREQLNWKNIANNWGPKKKKKLQSLKSLSGFVGIFFFLQWFFGNLTEVECDMKVHTRFVK